MATKAKNINLSHIVENTYDAQAYKDYTNFKNNPKKYFDEISVFCRTQAAFRWQIGMGILNMDYLKGMVRVAKENKQCKFLAFTRHFDIVNEYLNENVIPENLQIIFSVWRGNCWKLGKDGQEICMVH